MTTSRVALTRWTADDIRLIAVLREKRFTWRRVGAEFGCSDDAVKYAWRYWWLKMLRRYERAI